MRSSRRGKYLEIYENLTIRSVRRFAWTSSRRSKETRVPIAATASATRRLRAGGRRLHVLRGPVLLATARKRRTKVDWAEEVAGLLEGRCANCEKITLVRDNLDTIEQAEETETHLRLVERDQHPSARVHQHPASMSGRHRRQHGAHLDLVS